MIEIKSETAVFAGGCFWCTEAVFNRLKGVESVVPGYSGGKTENPNSNQIYYENTGHAEVVKIEFNPSVISYIDLLSVFFATHDPTSLNKQGADTGTQYRSSIFYVDENQKKIAKEYIDKLNQSGKYTTPIVTKIEPFTKFYEAEAYHKDYYRRNEDSMYCQIVIDPKIQKLYKEFGSLLK